VLIFDAERSSQKIVHTERFSYCLFQFQFWGVPGVYMPFSRLLGQFRFCFFNSFWSGKENAVRLAAESK
jgi:hypothetical protein